MSADFCFFFGSLKYITRLTDSFSGKRKTEICVQSKDLDDQNGVIGFRHFASSNVAVRLTGVQVGTSGPVAGPERVNLHQDSCLFFKNIAHRTQSLYWFAGFSFQKNFFQNFFQHSLFVTLKHYKVQIFWGGHKNLKKKIQFIWLYLVKKMGYFSNFFALLRILKALWISNATSSRV